MMQLIRTFGALFFNGNGTVVEEAENGETSQPPTALRGTVLAIDDDPAMLEALRPMLRAEGYNVLTALTGAKGLDMLRYCQREVRLVVLDYHMPLLDGSKTLAHLRKLDPRVKVLALTGIEPEMLPEEFRAGVNKILCKPYSTGELLSSINELLGFDPRTALARS